MYNMIIFYLLEVVGGRENGAWWEAEFELMSNEEAIDAEAPNPPAVAVGWI